LSGEKNLDALIHGMTATLVEGTYVFVTMSDGQIPDGVLARMVFQEEEGATLILLKTEAEAYGLDYEFTSRMITLNVHSSLEAVGFIAKVASALAEAGMSVNPVSGFFHDHLFVPEGHATDAMKILKKLAYTAG
jgi:hypothetical protein